MRQLKIRAWDLERKEMYYIDDLYFFEEEGIHEIIDGVASGHHATYIITSFTGKYDNNGNPVYDGDILSNGTVCQNVYWSNNQAAYRCNSKLNKGWAFAGMVNLLDVVGNIFEDPELISK